ncbi:MAG: rhomboid family intramembrane serine protease [Verrucomicrobiales bacterium]
MEDSPPEPDSLETIGRYPTRASAEEHGLVVVAMQFPCWISQDRSQAGGYELAVEPADVPRASAELRAYRQDTLDAQTEPGRPLPSFPHGRWLAFAYALALLLCFMEQGRDAEFEERFISDNLAIIDLGQRYRAATALFLHADDFHLFGNVIFGVGFGLWVCSSVGAWSGWALILLSGVLGNLINAHHYYPDLHRSLGASTAVFGALGILTGYGIIAAFLSPRSAPWARAILPIAGGIALLGWFGLGGPEVDIMAHVYGFACGIPLGFAAGWIRIIRGEEQDVDAHPES